MKRLIIAGPWWVLVAVIVAVCCLMTECRYESIAVWQGNCSPKEVTTTSEGKAALWLSCSGFPYEPPYSYNGYVVSRAAKRTLPQSFWCSVTRSGDSSCLLPK